ncbi:MAG: hypothetical protein IJK83_07270 [Clostridiales bacterium]|nr:hypothetical protein [Clostridiales bacterium]
MLYILTALKCEASALAGLPGEVVVTGVGGCAISTISRIDLTPNDHVLNVGICAGKEPGKGYLINQVISDVTGRRFYPDILFESGAEEMSITTSDKVVTEVGDNMLYDMESSLICDAVLKVVPPSNLAIYKVVSDSGDKFPSKNEVTQLIRAHIDEIKKIAELMIGGVAAPGYEFLPESIFEELRLTQYMRSELKDLEHYCAAAGREDELVALIDKMRGQERIPVKDKKAGREVLDEIYSYLR